MAVTKQHTGVSSPYEDENLQEAREARATQRPGLVLLYAPNFEQLHPAYPFGPYDITIGRDPVHAVCIPEQAVSRMHARIHRTAGPPGEGDVYVITDLGSRNGIVVDGKNVREAVLEPLSEVRIGDALFKFVDEGADVAAAYRIDGVVAGQRRARDFVELVGGAKMDAIAADIERIAATELSCVVLGETGTGKEVVARGIHRLSGRGSFQAINCAAIPQNLLESELFGYRRGAFSGADRDKPGLIKLADGGTLFLDEIGDMPIDAQAKLLRVLQSREVFPLGATMPERVDIRVVCATHRDLYSHVREGRFRGDLLARLNEHTVRLPPLRERKEDMLQLVRSFFVRYGKPQSSFTFSFMVALLHYDWPFNVRELESCVKRGLAIADDSVLDTMHLPDAIAEEMRGYGGKSPRPDRMSILPPSVSPSSRTPFGSSPSSSPPSPPATAPIAPKAPNEDELRAVLSRHKGNVAAVGRELGKERMQIHRWLKKYGISLDDYRE